MPEIYTISIIYALLLLIVYNAKSKLSEVKEVSYHGNIKCVVKVFEEIAKRENISVAEVREEIQHAIDETMRNPSEEVKKRLEEMGMAGEKPSIEEFILTLAKQLKHKQ